MKTQKTHRITLELTKAEIRKLSELMFKGVCYDDAYYDRRTTNFDENLREKICDQLVNNSDRYAGQNISVTTFNGKLTDINDVLLWL